MNKKTCIDCKYFFRHYFKHKKTYNEMYCGSCTFPKLKNKYVDDNACEYFEENKRRKKQNGKTLHEL